jgi:hypothetical protein
MKKEIKDDKNSKTVVINTAPCFPIKRPKNPAIKEPNNGKKIINKYIY